MTNFHSKFAIVIFMTSILLQPSIVLASEPTVSIVTHLPTGGGALGNAESLAISGSGNCIAFTHRNSALAENPAWERITGSAILVYYRETKIVTLASIPPENEHFYDGATIYGITDDCSRLIYRAKVEEPSGMRVAQSSIFVTDLKSRTTENIAPTFRDDLPSEAAISADGKTIAFISRAPAESQVKVGNVWQSQNQALFVKKINSIESPVYIGPSYSKTILRPRIDKVLGFSSPSSVIVETSSALEPGDRDSAPDLYEVNFDQLQPTYRLIDISSASKSNCEFPGVFFLSENVFLVSSGPARPECSTVRTGKSSRRIPYFKRLFYGSVEAPELKPIYEVEIYNGKHEPYRVLGLLSKKRALVSDIRGFSAAASACVRVISLADPNANSSCLDTGAYSIKSIESAVASADGRYIAVRSKFSGPGIDELSINILLVDSNQ